MEEQLKSRKSSEICKLTAVRCGVTAFIIYAVLSLERGADNPAKKIFTGFTEGTGSPTNPVPSVYPISHQGKSDNRRPLPYRHRLLKVKKLSHIKAESAAAAFRLMQIKQPHRFSQSHKLQKKAYFRDCPASSV